MAPKTKSEPKTFTPKALAEELQVDAKRIRAYLRSTDGLARPSEAKNTSWTLTEEQADMVRARFTPSEEDDSADEGEE